jgi:hypothetical protein
MPVEFPSLLSMRNILALTALLAALMPISHAQGTIITFSGKDANIAVNGPHPNSDAVASQFAAAAGSGVQTITFEDAPIGNFASLTVAPGVVLYLTNSTNHNPTNGITDNTTGGLFNTTPGGSKFVVGEAGSGAGPQTFTFVFSQPIDAFGTYIPGDWLSDEAPITCEFNDGGDHVILIPLLPASESNPTNCCYFGFTDAGTSISSVTIKTVYNYPDPQPGYYYWWYHALDDVSYHAALIPEPSALALLGVGVVGLLGRGLWRRWERAA